MTDFESLVLLMTCAVLLVAAAQKLKIPYPIALVVGGGLLSFVPNLDFTYIEPNLLLTIVLPPILYHAAFWTSVGSFKKHAKEICSLAVGLVIVTTCILALLFKWFFPQFSWALAFCFGAIVSPPDASCATAILKRFPLGAKLVTILEGESMVNDASALVLYRIAATALITGTFSFWQSGLEFIYMGLGGALLGVTLGYSFHFIAMRYLDPVVSTFSSFLYPYIIYIVAVLADTSGVLAVVASGIVASRIMFKYQSSLRRVLGRVSWDMYIILLNCFIFILIGSQLDEQTQYMSWHELFTYIALAFVFTAAMFFIRLVWACIKSAITVFRNKAEAERFWQLLQDGIIISWTGMRGIVSLTAALALPTTLSDGSLVEGRAELIFITYWVILFTLILPGLTLERLISWLRLPQLVHATSAAETRRSLAKVAQDEISKLQDLQAVSEEERSLLFDYFHNRHRLWELISPDSGNHYGLDSARKRIVNAQRRVLLEIWEKGAIDDKLLAELEHELDSEELHTIRAEI